MPCMMFSATSSVGDLTMKVPCSSTFTFVTAVKHDFPWEKCILLHPSRDFYRLYICCNALTDSISLSYSGLPICLGVKLSLSHLISIWFKLLIVLSCHPDAMMFFRKGAADGSINATVSSGTLDQAVVNHLTIFSFTISFQVSPHLPWRLSSGLRLVMASDFIPLQ